MLHFIYTDKVMNCMSWLNLNMWTLFVCSWIAWENISRCTINIYIYICDVFFKNTLLTVRLWKNVGCNNKYLFKWKYDLPDRGKK